MATCHDCGATLRFVRMRTGKAMPVNPVPDPAGIVAALPAGSGRHIDGRVITEQDPPAVGEIRFRPHWADCSRGKQPKINRPEPPSHTEPEPLF